VEDFIKIAKSTVPEEKSLKDILKKIHFTDDAKVMKQLVDQSLQVKIRMGQIRRKIVVMSGKGGVGKSTTTANLALAFARAGHKVGVLDIDLNGPCIPQMLGVSGSFEIRPDGAVPPTGPYGIKVASMALFLTEKNTPVRWKGSMELSPVWLGMFEMNVIRELLADIIWGDLDYLIADLPPGASADKPPVIAGFLPELDGAVVVTTPSEVAKTVVRKSIVYAQELGIRVIGLVENMSGAICPTCQSPVSLFTEEGSGCEDIAVDMNLPILGKIAFDSSIARSCDQGIPLPVSHPMSVQFDAMVIKIESFIEKKKAFLTEKS
jgi:ATP-binding protein involved in chromosome partitioning